MKTVRLTESDLVRIVKRVISEQPTVDKLQGVPPKIKIFKDNELLQNFDVKEVKMEGVFVTIKGNVPQGKEDEIKYSCRSGKFTNESVGYVNLSPEVEKKIKALCDTYVNTGSGNSSSYA
jgi:hypothetical protein